MALSFLCGGLGVASAADVVHVTESASGTAEVYTKTGVDTLLDDYGKKEDVQNNKNNIANLQTTTINQGQKITENTTNIANNKAAIDKKIDTETADAKLALKADATSVFTKDEVNTKLTDYAKSDDVYTKTAADGKFATSAALNTAKTDLEGEITTAKNELDGKIAANTTKITANEKAIQNLNAKAGNTETTLNNLSGHMTTAENNITDLKDADVRLEGKIDRNANDITGLKDKDGELSGKINDNKNLIDQNKTNITKNAADITNINEKLTTAEGNIQTNTDNINALDKKVGTINNGTYLDGKASVADNLGKLDAGLKQEVTDRKTADDALSGRITANANTIAKVNQELVNTNNHFNTELRKTNDHFNTELRNTNAALQATNKRTAGIGRTDTGVEADNQTVIEGKVHFDQNGNVSGVKDLKTDTIHATGEITSEGLDAGSGEITTKGKVSAGDISTGTLETTGNAKIGGNLDVTGTLNIKDVTAETIHISKSENTTEYQSKGSIIGDGGKLSVSNEKTYNRTNITKESQLNVNEEGTVNWATSTDGATGNVTEGRSEVTADKIKNSVKKTEGGKTFGYEENITADGKVGTVTDKDGNRNELTQTATGTENTVTSKDGNKSTTKQEAGSISSTVYDKDGKVKASSEMKEDGSISNNATGDISNTAQNVTNEGRESVTNKVRANEVKVSTDGVDIKAEDGKKITESVGTASRVVENDKITDNAGDSTVTTENGKGTTFGKVGITGTTNIYGDSIKTGTINANDTTTDKLTAGAAAGADGGRLTVDADGGVKGSYTSGDYTSRSYILANTLQSGVDNGKKPTDADFVGSRTDHYMVGDKAKLDETVKDAAGSNVTNKTSTSTKSTIKKGDITTAVKQEGDKIESSIIKDDNSQSNVTTSTVEATANAVTGKDANGNAQTSTVINNKDGLLITNTDNQTSFTTEDGTPTGPAQSWTNIKGNEISTGKVEANYVKMSYADVMKDLGVRGNATVDKDMTVKGNTTLGEAGKDTTLKVNSKATFNEKATFENGAEVKNGLTVSSGESTFNDKVTMKNGLDVTGGVASDSFTVKGTDIKIDSSGINAGGTVISNVADGSISEGSKDAVNGGQLYQVKNDLEGKVNKVGANAAAMANLHPMEFDPDSKWNIAAAMGNYGSETATAIGAFYRPNEDVMVNFSTAFGTGENMVGGGVSVRLGKGSNKLSREESNALKAQVNDLTARMDALLSVLNPNMSKDFPDVPENHWAYEAVSRLAGNDIVQGYPDGEFHGERTMTRYEMAEIIYNALSRGAEAERELVEEFKPELQAMAASEKATAERAEG